jgi:hypothetical protein
LTLRQIPGPVNVIMSGLMPTTRQLTSSPLQRQFWPRIISSCSMGALYHFILKQYRLHHFFLGVSVRSHVRARFAITRLRCSSLPNCHINSPANKRFPKQHALILSPLIRNVFAATKLFSYSAMNSPSGVKRARYQFFRPINVCGIHHFFLGISAEMLLITSMMLGVPSKTP